MKIQLDKVKKRINIEDYSIKEILEYFKTFDNYLCIIQTENNTIKFKIHKESFPHLIGIQHISKSTKYKGQKGIKEIENNNINFNTIKKNLKHNKNYIYLIKNITLRLEYLPMFFNTLMKNTNLKKLNKEKILRKTLLKGNYLLFKNVKAKNNTLYPLLSLKQIKNDLYIIETFIVENNISLIGNLPEEKILNIELIPTKILQII